MQKYVIALYIRLSLEDYKYDSMSIENQHLALNEFVSSMPESANAEVLEFIDNGYSGTNFERPKVQELIEMVRANKIDCIIVKDFSRFGRNSIETGYFIERVFPLFHTRFISINDDFDSDQHKGDTGGMDVAFKYLISEYAMNIAEARSYKNGIDFYVNSKKLTIKARREEDGKISVTTTHDAPQVERTQYRTLIVLGLTAIAVIFWNILKETTLGYKLIGGLGCLWILVYGYYFITSKIASNKPSFKYHAAEHKVLNYYEKHKCIPTQIEEVAKEKSISYRCGSTVIAVILLFITIIGIVFAITSIWWIRLISFGLAVYTVLAMWANGLCDFLQKYALLEPGREELEVALKGIEEYDRINTSL